MGRARNAVAFGDFRPTQQQYDSPSAQRCFDICKREARSALMRSVRRSCQQASSRWWQSGLAIIRAEDGNVNERTVAERNRKLWIVNEYRPNDQNAP